MDRVSLESLRAAQLDWIVDVSFLGRLTAAAQNEVLARFEERRYPSGRTIVPAGTRMSGVNLIIAGTAHVLTSEDESPIARLGAGHLFGERSVLFRVGSNAAVIAAQEVRALHMAAADFEALLEQLPALARYVEDLVELRDRAAEITTLIENNEDLRYLSRDDRERFVLAAQLRRIPAGEPLLRAGDRSTEVYLSLTGQLAPVITQDGERRRLEARGPGWLFGHVAMMLNAPRTATIEATTDAEVLELSGSAFRDLLMWNPALRRRIEAELATLELDLSRAAPGSRISVRSEDAKDATTFAYALAAALARRGDVVRLVDLDLPMTLRRLGVDAAPEGWGFVVEGVEPGAWPVRKAELEAEPGALVLAAGAHDTRLEQSVWMRPASGLSRTEKGRGFQMEVIAVDPGSIVPFADATRAVRRRADPTSEQAFWARGDLEPVVSTSTSYGRCVHRALRVIEGRTVGVALGGGGAFGFGHLALLQGLEEAEIPVDYVAGTSFGALVGALYVAGGNALLEQLVAQRVKLQGLGLTGAVSLVPLTNWVRELTQSQSLGSTEVPFFPVSLDLRTGREVILSRGDLADGVRASSSLAGVYPAFERGAQRLVDGAMINSVPASVVWDAGADFTLASNVFPLTPMGLAPSAGRNPLSKLLDATKGRYDDMRRATFIMMAQMGRDRARMADYVFNLELEGTTPDHFYRGDAIVRTAAEQVRAEMPAILAARG